MLFWCVGDDVLLVCVCVVLVWCVVVCVVY